LNERDKWCIIGDKMDLKQLGCKHVDWIRTAQVKSQWRNCRNTVMNPGLHIFLYSLAYHKDFGVWSNPCRLKYINIQGVMNGDP
jgi:hypothetical protein